MFHGIAKNWRPDGAGKSLSTRCDSNRHAHAAIEPVGDVGQQRRSHGAIAQQTDDKQLRAQKGGDGIAI
jgi:hypothetical protein